MTDWNTKKAVLSKCLSTTSKLSNQTCKYCMTINQRSKPTDLLYHFLTNSCDVIRQFCTIDESIHCVFCTCKFVNFVNFSHHLESIHNDKCYVACFFCKQIVRLNNLQEHYLLKFPTISKQFVDCRACAMNMQVSKFLSHLINDHKLMEAKINRVVISRYLKNCTAFHTLIIMESKKHFNKK